MTGDLHSDALRLIDAALAEDLDGRGLAGDLTTHLVLAGASPSARGRIVAKAPGCLSGVRVAARVFEQLDPRVGIELPREDGDEVAPGDEVLRLSGDAAPLLAGERTALNLLQRLSGVATTTARFVACTEGTRARILDTRKTTPAWRTLEKAAVVHGGGHNHRYGLFDEILIKENHFAMGGVDHGALVARVRAAAPDGVRVVAESETLGQARAMLDAGADVVLLDNFAVEELARAVGELASHPRRAAFELEASGGVSLETVAAIARTGVDRISVGGLTHSAPALDLSMSVEATPS